MAHRRQQQQEKQEVATGRNPCQVCQDTATGIHFGAVTCESCKLFFLRLSKKAAEAWMLNCSQEAPCPITPTTRACCRACRYRKCVQVGMSRANCCQGRVGTNKPRSPPHFASGGGGGLIRGPVNHRAGISSFQRHLPCYRAPPPQFGHQMNMEYATHPSLNASCGGGGGGGGHQRPVANYRIPQYEALHGYQNGPANLPEQQQLSPAAAAAAAEPKVVREVSGEAEVILPEVALDDPVLLADFAFSPDSESHLMVLCCNLPHEESTRLCNLHNLHDIFDRTVRCEIQEIMSTKNQEEVLHGLFLSYSHNFTHSYLPDNLILKPFIDLGVENRTEVVGFAVAAYHISMCLVAYHHWMRRRPKFDTVTWESIMSVFIRMVRALKLLCLTKAEFLVFNCFFVFKTITALFPELTSPEVKREEAHLMSLIHHTLQFEARSHVWPTVQAVFKLHITVGVKAFEKFLTQPVSTSPPLVS